MVGSELAEEAEGDGPPNLDLPSDGHQDPWGRQGWEGAGRAGGSQGGLQKGGKGLALFVFPVAGF